MEHQDWNVVDVGRKTGGKLTKEEELIKKKQMERSGLTISKQKTKFNGPDNSKILNDANEPNKIEKLKVGQQIMQGRVAQKLTRKQLASKLNIKEEVIASFENNKALSTPENKKLLNKIKRVIKIN